MSAPRDPIAGDMTGDPRGIMSMVAIDVAAATAELRGTVAELTTQVLVLTQRVEALERRRPVWRDPDCPHCEPCAVCS